MGCCAVGFGLAGKENRRRRSLGSWCMPGMPVLGRRSAAECAVQEEENENEEAEAENQEGKLAWAGGRKEEATYEAGDAEDTAIAAAAQQAAQQQDLGPEVSTQPFLLSCTACLIC